METTNGHWLSRSWAKLRTLWSVLAIIRFSILLAAISVAALVIGQGQEALQALGEAHGSGGDIVRRVLFVAATVLCGFSVWYSARIMFLFRFPNPASDPDCLPGVKRHAPRLLGGTVVLAAAVACVFAARHAYPAGPLWVLAVVFLVVGLAFLYFVYQRRKLLAKFLALASYESQATGLTNLRSLEPATKRVIIGLFLIGAVITWIVSYQFVWLGTALGSPSVVMLAAALIVPIGSAVVYWGNKYSVPALAMLLVAAVVFSRFNDNHFVRLIAGMRSYDDPAGFRGAVTPSPRKLEDYVNQWLDDRAPTNGKPLPVFIVAAEGGGIRAAYWTGAVLGALEDEAARTGQSFSRHLLAVSGVSGGSLGGGVFSALVRQGPRADGDGPLSYRRRAHEILSQDFVGPTLSVMLFTDLQQRFVPFGLFDDRATALETAWENAWTEAGETGLGLRTSISELWPPGPTAEHPPMVLLNSTVVETGQRLIMGPFAFSGVTFAEALDGAHILGTQLPLSTAMHLSARFTYVSPAGTVYWPGADASDRVNPWFRLVDGGYFENSGAVTASELLRLLRSAARKRSVTLDPMVIRISNDPRNVPPEEPRPNDGKRAWVGEVLSPLWALLNARPARGYQARDALAGDVCTQSETACHTHFDLYQGARGKSVKLPLGWTLSSASQCEMQRQLRGRPEAVRTALTRDGQYWASSDHRGTIAKVLGKLGVTSVGPPSADTWVCPENK